MANNSSFQWRTVIEVGVISAIIYILIGSPGLPNNIRLFSSNEKSVKPDAARGKYESLVYPRKDLRCPKHQFDIHVFSTSPLVIYIDGFTSEAEANHLIEISKEKWQVSTVFNNGIETTDEKVRKSEKALIDRDETVQCIEQRALSIQGWPEHTFIERLWTQRYNESGHYSHHYDWATASKTSRRVSTFMVYLSAECSGGGTNFPLLKMPVDERWCEYVECSSSDEGVTFKARKGSAVFWTNFDQNDRGYRETLHAGMPVTSGTKIGLNMWSWYQAGHVPDDPGY